jgi:nicotinamidase/pyrazinamidase
VVGPSKRFAGTLSAYTTIQKSEFDVFRNPEAGRVFDLYGRDNPTFVVYGVATDYCVKAAVLGLLDRGHKVAVVADAVRAIDAGREADVFAEFVRRGALLTITDAVCGEALSHKQSHAR